MAMATAGAEAEATATDTANRLRKRGNRIKKKRGPMRTTVSKVVIVSGNGGGDVRRGNWYAAVERALAAHFKVMKTRCRLVPLTDERDRTASG